MTLVVQKPSGGKLLMRQTWAPADTDAAAYIAAVEAADGQALEERTRKAIDDFVIGCKADGIWTAIKASCILAGARTLTGALVPLVGAAPTNNNFVSGDYNRKTGLVGNGSTKYLNSNRAGSADPRNSRHLALYVSSTGADNKVFAGDAVYSAEGNTSLYVNASSLFGGRSTHPASLGASDVQIGTVTASTSAPTLFGIARTASNSQTLRGGKISASNSTASAVPTSSNAFIFTNSALEVPASARLAFYSIGESLDLTLLDARVTQLVNTFAAVIP
jgi:hypothetical protein